jgi:hypothetical protein
MPNHRLETLVFAAALGAVALAHGGCEDEALVGLCEPGSNIFCRCPGGAPGTKSCDESGQSFGACLPCDERPSTGPAGQGAGAGGSGSGQGPGGGPVGEEPILSPCEGDGECQTGMCRMGFCTRTCTVVSDCPFPASECVTFDGTTMCIPACATASDCAPFTAPPSLCGYTTAVDNWDVTVCAHWGENHQVTPAGTDCLPFDHAACNLGYPGRAIVCTEQGVCAAGCFTDGDCPSGQTCPDGGALGNCQ